jgi:L-ascorbate metabolism protein UlaG (beta-lactamase superfamily)
MSAIHTINLSTEDEEVDVTKGSLLFAGTATTLISYAGFTILTDPNFLRRGEILNLGYGVRSPRLTRPELQIDDLPPLDLVIISSLQEDHFDRIAARYLPRKTPIATTPQAAARLQEMGFTHIHALATWQTLELVKGQRTFRLTAMPGERIVRIPVPDAPAMLEAQLPSPFKPVPPKGALGPLAKPVAHLFPAVMGSMMEFEATPGKTAFRIYVSGDVLASENMTDIAQRYPAIDLALLHLGGEKLFGHMVTMDGKQGVEAMKRLNAHQTIPIHFDDYKLFKSSLEDFQQAATKAHLVGQVLCLERGHAYTLGVPASRL